MKHLPHSSDPLSSTFFRRWTKPMKPIKLDLEKGHNLTEIRWKLHHWIPYSFPSTLLMLVWPDMQLSKIRSWERYSVTIGWSEFGNIFLSQINLGKVEWKLYLNESLRKSLQTFTTGCLVDNIYETSSTFIRSAVFHVLPTLNQTYETY